MWRPHRGLGQRIVGFEGLSTQSHRQLESMSSTGISIMGSTGLNQAAESQSGLVITPPTGDSDSVGEPGTMV